MIMDQNFPAYRGSPFIETTLIEVALYHSNDNVSENILVENTVYMWLIYVLYAHIEL